MAAAMSGKNGPTRVFVLVDAGTVQGVFLSWDAAEAYADLNNLPLDHLFEFVTGRDHQDHLHLLTARWEGSWDFQGEWKREMPRWKRPPAKVRLDHYHLKGNQFLLLRQKEFIWSTGLLLRIDPMAPDQILDQIGSQAASAPKKHWKPKLGAIKPAIPPVEPKTNVPVPGLAESSPKASMPLPEDNTAAKKPLIPEPEPPLESFKSNASAPPPLDNAAKAKPKLAKTDDLEKQEKVSVDIAPEAKSPVSFPKRSPLKLRERHTPQPIPEFAPTLPPEPVSKKSSVEMAQIDVSGTSDIESDSEQAEDKINRVWPMRLILPVLALIVFWAGGVYYVFRPQPTAQEVISSITSLNSANVIAIEPGQVFFQMPIDPIHQQRWVRTLGMDAVTNGNSLSIPHYHTLDTWSKASGYIRPPYAAIEVREWWDLRIRQVAYGFVLNWDDGSVLILDLESDMLIGWMDANHLPEILN